MTDKLRDKLAPFYQDKLAPIFDADAPKEEKATCLDCAMCAKGEPVKGATYFRPDTKCCTYHPTLPSYLVGGILGDDSPEQAEGKRRVLAQIASRLGVTPRWVSASQKYWAIWSSARETSFGRSRALLCPYLSDGMCSIWRYRESECSTFFCKHDHGQDGKLLWNSVRDTMRHAERMLSAHAVKVVAPELLEPTVQRNEMTLEELEDRPPEPERYSSIWQSWEGREAELYRACFEVVRALDREAVTRIVMEEDGAPLHAELAERVATLSSDALPTRLVLNPRAKVADGEGGAFVTTFSKYEPLFLNDTLLAVLREMSATETVDEFRARMLRENEIDVPTSALVSLRRFRVVVDPNDPTK